MNVGKNVTEAIAHARANARLAGANRYIWMYAGDYWVEQDRPNGAFGSFHYTEVHPDGTYAHKETTLEPESQDGKHP